MCLAKQLARGGENAINGAMKSLLIMRHAKSSWDNSHVADHDRPLNRRGQEDAPRVGRFLLREELVPDLIISSTAERALATAEAVALASDYAAAIITTRNLYHAGPEEIVEVVRRRAGDAGRLLVVGHNPGMEELLSELTGVYERFTTANVAHLTPSIDDWSAFSLESRCQLLNIWRPKEL